MTENEADRLRTNFVKWVKEGIDERGWSIRELGRRCAFSHTHISNTINGVRNVTWELCEALAHAFGQTPESAFRRVGLLPDNVTPAKELQEILNYLPREEREDVLRYAEWKRREIEAA